jgi:hypothetical protein
MATGWHGESKRYSIAKKYGAASSKDTAISPMSSRCNIANYLERKDAKFFKGRDFRSFHLGLEVTSDMLDSGVGEIVGFGENDLISTLLVRDSNTHDIMEIREGDVEFDHRHISEGSFVKDLATGNTGEVVDVNRDERIANVRWDGSPANIVEVIPINRLANDLRKEPI